MRASIRWSSRNWTTVSKVDELKLIISDMKIYKACVWSSRMIVCETVRHEQNICCSFGT